MGYALIRRTIPAFAAAALLAACATAQSASPAQLVDAITKGVYADDMAAATAPFDDDLKKTVTRSELGELSDKMHALGAYQSATQKSASPDQGRYDYTLTFDHGTMLAELRLDPSGKVGAYRVVPAP